MFITQHEATWTTSTDGKYPSNLPQMPRHKVAPLGVTVRLRVLATQAARQPGRRQTHFVVAFVCILHFSFLISLSHQSLFTIRSEAMEPAQQSSSSSSAPAAVPVPAPALPAAAEAGPSASTIEAPAQQGEVQVFQPADASNAPSKFNPLAVALMFLHSFPPSHTAHSPFRSSSTPAMRIPPAYTTPPRADKQHHPPTLSSTTTSQTCRRTMRRSSRAAGS